jgi:hypothetical protein
MLALGGPWAALANQSQAAHAPSVASALLALRRAGEISPALYGQYSSQYLAAESSLGRLSGTRASELGGVLANVRAIAVAGELIPSRLPVLFLTLRRNRQWWTSDPLLSDDQRVSFPGSRLVWEYYPGQGIEIQWLATFGEANGYYLSGNQNGALRELLNEVIPLATERAGGIAWEYLFRFDGGSPPWTSGLSQGTALQALSRAWSRLKEPAYLQAAKEALSIFVTAPPAGVRVPTAAGAHYLEYSFAPKERILNGFIQSLVGLYDYASLTGDPVGQRLFEAGDAEARAEVPHYDTGAWSRYDQSSESDLNYHELLTTFLQNLCQRTNLGEPIAGQQAPTPPSQAPSTTRPGTPVAPNGGSATPEGAAVGAAGGSAAPASARRAGAAAVGIPGDSIYCATAQRFGSDLHTKPVLALLSRTLPAGARAGVEVWLSKIATLEMTVRRVGTIVWTNRATVEAGTPRLLWVTPPRTGSYSVAVQATDLAGNRASTSGTVVLSAARARTPH